MTPRCGRRRQDAAEQGRNTTGLARSESRIFQIPEKGKDTQHEHGNQHNTDDGRLGVGVIR